MERWNQLKTLVLGLASDIWDGVTTNPEYVTLGGIALLLCFIAWKGWAYYKATEGERAMSRARYEDEQRMMRDYLTNLLLHLHQRGKLTEARFDYWNRVFGLMLDVRYLVTHSRAKELKARIKKERNSNDPEMVAIRENKTKPIPDMGPAHVEQKGGSEVNALDVFANKAKKQAA